MTIFTVGFSLLAALLHVYIWVLESFRWTEPATRKTFGTSEADAEITRPMAYNQGFYNLFLAIITLVGLALYRHRARASARRSRSPAPARCSPRRSSSSPTTARWCAPR